MEQEIEPQEDLDILYSQYLINLKNVILKITDPQDVNYCKRWLEAFNNCQPDQKMVRNCLVSMMYQQLDNDGHLSEPFIDLSKIYCNLNDIFVDEDTQELLSTKSPLNTFNNTDNSMNELDCASPLNQSCISEVPPISNRHLSKIDDLTKFIVNMRNINENLQKELKRVKKERSVLEMKIERKDTEMEKLLHLARNGSKKTFPTLNCPIQDASVLLSNRINSIIESYDANKINLSFPTIEKKDEEIQPIQNTQPSSPNISEASCLSETKFFKLLDHIAIALENYSRSVAPDEDFSDGIDHLKFPSEGFKCKDIELRVQAFQKRVQQALIVAMNNVRGHIAKVKRVMAVEHIAIQTDIEKLSLDKVTVTKTTQTRTLQLRSSTDGESTTRESLKINLLRSCVYKLKRSRDKWAERYERKMKEKSIQDAIQRKLWKLQIASLRSHLQMNVICRSQTQLCEITEALESKYKSIITETFDQLTKRIKNVEEN